METLEENFRIKFQKVLSSNGWSNYHIDGIPGFPDILMSQGRDSILVELKVIRGGDMGKGFKTLFKPAQMPFYIRSVTDSHTPIYIAVKIESDVPSFFCVELSQTKDIIDLFASKCKDLVVKYGDKIFSEYLLIEDIYKKFKR